MSRCSDRSRSTSMLMRERLGADVSAAGSTLVARRRERLPRQRRLRRVRQQHLPQHRASTTAPHGWYYVHFPEPPPTPRDVLRHQDRRRCGAQPLPCHRGCRTASPRSRPGSTAGCGAPSSCPPISGTSPTPSSRPAGSSGSGARRRRAVPAGAPGGRGRAIKEPMILNVGRFFDPTFGHSKKQLELIDAFAGARDSADWRLHARRRLRCRRTVSTRWPPSVAAIGRPDRRPHQRHRRRSCSDLFAAASIYWHAGGLGEDPERHPERFEHFGITRRRGDGGRRRARRVRRRRSCRDRGARRQRLPLAHRRRAGGVRPIAWSPTSRCGRPCRSPRSIGRPTSPCPASATRSVRSSATRSPGHADSAAAVPPSLTSRRRTACRPTPAQTAAAAIASAASDQRRREPPRSVAPLDRRGARRPPSTPTTKRVGLDDSARRGRRRSPCQPASNCWSIVTTAGCVEVDRRRGVLRCVVLDGQPDRFARRPARQLVVGRRSREACRRAPWPRSAADRARRRPAPASAVRQAIASPRQSGFS